MPSPNETVMMDRIPATQISLSEAQTSSLRDVYLSRLERLVRLRCQHEQELNGRGIRLLDRTIFAVYYDCRRAGLEREARELLQQSEFDIDGSVDAFAADEDDA